MHPSEPVFVIDQTLAELMPKPDHLTSSSQIVVK
jgi:hypothetical protein